MFLHPKTLGTIAIWKPVGPTSHDIIDIVRRITGEKTVGHAGTLDPLAEGVLVIAIGRDATQKIAESVAKEKRYDALIELGATSETDDSEGPLLQTENARVPSKKELEDALALFRGRIMQTPPRYSAVKVGGRSAWVAARRGKVVPIAAREVEVKSLELVSYQYPFIRLMITTGPGVYIRSIARDLGQNLSCGAYLKSLVRTQVGSWTEQSSIRLATTGLLTKK